MEKNQFKLCMEILRRFYKSGILDDFILIGSWCVYFYKNYFSEIPSIHQITIKTRDLDFLINNPSKIKHNVNIPELLKDLGFITDFKGHQGYIKLDHPDLILEFLVPEKGKGIDKPYPLPKFGINATTLRFLNFLSDNIIKVKVENFYLSVPHPANFALHKLIISQRRVTQEKALKDSSTAIEILNALISKNETHIIKNIFRSIPQKWQNKITNCLKDLTEQDILEILQRAD